MVRLILILGLLFSFGCFSPKYKIGECLVVTLIPEFKPFKTETFPGMVEQIGKKDYLIRILGRENIGMFEWPIGEIDQQSVKTECPF
jgi:hypothetical protein